MEDSPRWHPLYLSSILLIHTHSYISAVSVCKQSRADNLQHGFVSIMAMIEKYDQCFQFLLSSAVHRVSLSCSRLVPVSLHPE